MTSKSLLFATLLALPPCLLGQDSPAFPPPPANVSSVVHLAPQAEPGVPLIITGTVFQNDKTTPAPNILLYFYQVDASGEYRRHPKTRIPRLNGWVKTDKDGRYEIRTVKPASYPNSRVVAHIHSFVQFQDGMRTWIQDFLFDDDPHLSASARNQASAEGPFSRVLRIEESDNGVLRAVRNIVIKR